MAAPKKSTAKKPTRKNPADDERSRNLLQQVGDEAMRKVLLKTLKDNGWSLLKTAQEFGMYSSTVVIRAIHQLGLTEEYERAKERGDVRPGPRAE